MPLKRLINCSVTGVATTGVELTPGAISAIHPKVHAARKAGRTVPVIKNAPPVQVPRRSKKDKEAAAAASSSRRGARV